MSEKRLIDANALRQTMESNLYWGLDSDGAVLDTIDDAPTVDAVEVVHGRWERLKELPNAALHYCSICGYPEIRTCNYCPKCGADMRERSTDV